MFGQFLHIVVSSLKLDRNIFRDPKYFGEAAIYFAVLIMILDGVAGAVAANTFVKTSIGVSGITALVTWLIWSIFIYVIGVKLFPDGNSKIPFKRVLIGVGYAHAPGLIRFFAVSPEFVVPIIFLTQFWIFAALIILFFRCMLPSLVGLKRLGNLLLDLFISNSLLLMILVAKTILLNI